MDSYATSKRKLALLKMKIKKLEERRALERERRRIIKKISVVAVMVATTVAAIVFVFY